MNGRREVFGTIHRRNRWGSRESVSGTGSTLAATRALRRRLPDVLRQLGVRTLADAPCGDGRWIRPVSAGLDFYLGVDIVDALVLANSRANQRPDHLYIVFDLAAQVLPPFDAILCRDLLGHLAPVLARRVLENLRLSGSRYLIATTFPDRVNRAIRTGGWYPINLEAAPFSLPPPILRIPDREPGRDDPYRDKSLGVWPLAELEPARGWAEPDTPPGSV